MEKLIAQFICSELKIIFGMVDKQEVVVTPNVDNKVPDNVDDIINAIPKLDEGSQN